MTHIKKRRITHKDWATVQEFVVREIKRRETDKFRKQHETIWREVDRQVSMRPKNTSRNDPNDDSDWHAEVELGDLARASEVLSADVRRLLFPTNRTWLEAHSELRSDLNEDTGERKVNPVVQKKTDEALRAFMTQQHVDFGLKSRVDLSVKEALHHGSYVVEVVEEDQLLVSDGNGIHNQHAPVWRPYSMWNAYPDPSPSIVGSNIVYSGSMVLKEYLPLHKLKLVAKGDGWMASQISKIKTKKNKNKDVETQDIELIKFYGDVVIKRNDGDIFLPNSKVINANGIIVFYAPVETPFPPVIFGGYERLDVRDPYFTSPLIKLSPMQGMGSQLAGRMMDAVDLETEPSIMYDGNDPTFVANGGPLIAPGAKTATKGSAKYEVIKAGNSQSALIALQHVNAQMALGTAVDASRAGGGENVEKSATEIRNSAQRGEVRVVDFVDKLEFSMKTFLYMQHTLNKLHLERYPFYNPEMDAPDFMWATKKELPENVHFEIIGAKGVLGEEERTQKTMAVTAFASSNEMFAPLIKPIALLQEAYQDAGNKNPERFLNLPDPEEDARLKAVMEQAQAQIEEFKQQADLKIHELEKDLDIQRAVNAARVEEAKLRANIQGEISIFKAQNEAELAEFKAEIQANTVKTQTFIKEQLDEFKGSLKKGPTEVKIIRESSG